MDMEDFTGKESKRWQDFCNEQLAPLLYPNMCRTWSDSYTAFGYINNHPQFSWLQKVSIRYLGSLAMYLAASRVKSKYQR
jgi:microsomal prostaglandin-E synthase 2